MINEIESIINDLRENDAVLRQAYQDKTCFLENKKNAEGIQDEWETLAQLQGIGTKKEHGANAEARKQCKMEWLHGKPAYVSALADIQSAEYDLIEVNEEIAYRHKQLRSIEITVELMRQKMKQQDVEAAVAGL